MPPHHSKRSVLITGCSNGGLGAALAEAFHETGRWRVIASARDLTKLQSLKGLKNGQEEDGIEQVQLDVVDEASVRAAVVAVRKLLADGNDGRKDGEKVGLDAICLNAGGGYSMPLTDIPPFSPLLPAVFNLNVFSQLSILNVFLPLLLASSSCNSGKPLVIAHTSIAAHPNGNLPFTGAYNASKAAMSHLTQCLRTELGLLDIDVIELRTGGVRSQFYGNLQQGKARVPEGSIWETEGVKEVVEGLMDGEKFGAGFSERAEWAREIVRDVENGTQKIIYRGSNAANVKWVGRLIPMWIYDMIMARMLGIGHLPGLLRAALEGRSLVTEEEQDYQG
ncbi:NADPH-dependent 1-acyldihydroxyacetone phosphate [Cyphellophora attinorum]|uniref:NADPH-dependent 1-acyldihydroxyacetone phosphate n=1 Tax=Cyphellophora attinorum TaxID=1664694 RepID=A0A0N1H388_9EURO|nr:NADPH-dependent 1-acyldihydroxyacetone phosphate [Phialophora attinorum]KPI39270.1 NADPH-dependent 1-acyldihydroxyacetone phosphate [Phialophora attinorum]